MNAMLYMLVCYVLIWCSFSIGYVFIGQKNEISRRFEKFLWNSRIDKMQRPPFTWIMLQAEKRNLLLFILVIIINSTMVLTEFLLGIVFIGPLFLIQQGFMDGALIAQADKRTKIFSILVLVFELGGFASASGLGLFLIVEQLFRNNPILENIINLHNSKILWIPFILLFLNGIFEGSGGYFNIEGVPGIKAVREKLYK